MTVSAHVPAPLDLWQRGRGRLVQFWQQSSGWRLLLAAVLVYFALRYLALAAACLLLVVTVELGRERWHGGGPERVAGRRTALVGALGTALACALVRLPSALAHLAALAITVGTLQVLLDGRDREQDDRVFTHEKLARAMVKAGIIAQPKDQTLPTLLWRGRKRDDLGETATISMGGAATYAKVTERRTALAAALGLPDRLLVVTYDTDTPADVVTLWAGRKGTRESTPSPLATTAQTVWTDPVRIGADPQGRPVTLSLPEQNTLVAGKPGFGKSTMLRLLVAHALLDPTSRLIGICGKGSRSDWSPVVPLADRWVWGTDDEAAEQTVDLLDVALRTVRERNSAETVPDGGWPLLLVLLEELQDVRSGATKEQQEKIDTALGRVIRMGRAVSVHVVISTQRPSVEDVPSGVRNLVSQNLALVTRNGADAALVLGITPTLPLPTRRGEALLVTPAGETGVSTDLLDGEAWRAVCARAYALRIPDQPAPAVVEDDPLATAVRALLADLGPMRPAHLLEQLPADVRPRDAQALGLALRAMPGVVPTRIGRQSRPGYALGSPGTAVGEPRATPGVDLRKPCAQGSEPVLHAQLPPVTGRVVVLPALP